MVSTRNHSKDSPGTPSPKKSKKNTNENSSNNNEENRTEALDNGAFEEAINKLERYCAGEDIIGIMIITKQMNNIFYSLFLFFLCFNGIFFDPFV